MYIMLYDKINKDMMVAMKSHDKDTLSTIRLLKSAIDLQKINNKLDSVTDELVIEVASKQVKQHKESIIEFRNANRNDLADKLENEIKIISNYLPEQLSKEEIEKEIDRIFDLVKPESKKDMGKIMKEANISLKGKADFKLVSEMVNSKLGAQASFLVMESKMIYISMFLIMVMQQMKIEWGKLKQLLLELKK